jgi:RimJ/RimL family protein N-acetyltransferase
MTERFPHPYTIEDAKWWIQKNSGDDATHFAVALDGKVIGGAGFDVDDRQNECAEIGYWLGEAYWGCGFGTSVVKTLSDYAFAKHGLRRLFARVLLPNLASAKVLEKCGYVREGVMRQALMNRGKLYDVFLYAAIR